MHACGHDGHTAAVLGAVLGLQDLVKNQAAPCPSEAHLKGTLRTLENGAREQTKITIARIAEGVAQTSRT